MTPSARRSFLLVLSEDNSIEVPFTLYQLPYTSYQLPVFSFNNRLAELRIDGNSRNSRCGLNAESKTRMLVLQAYLNQFLGSGRSWPQVKPFTFRQRIKRQLIDEK